MGLIRMHHPETVHFITNRCEHEAFFMLPSKEINAIIINWLVKAHALYGEGIEIYAFIFLANHLHLLLKNPAGNLARFMCYFESNVAREINRHLDRKGRFFSREYDDVIVEGDDAFLDRYCYIACNAVKAGLVENAGEWPGINSMHHALTEDPYKVRVLNRTKYHNATRRGKEVDKEKFVETFEMQLAIPPMWADKSPEERRKLIEERVAAAEHTYHAKRAFKPCLGVDKILEQKHTDRPKSVARSPRFKILCFDEARKKELLDSYRKFVGSYREMWDGFRKAAAIGQRPAVEWPDWSYPPSCWQSIATPAT